MRFHIITLFPETFDAYLNESIIGRAIKAKKIAVSFYDPRKYAPKELKKKWPDGNVTVYADGRPFGGGPGMVLRAEPYVRAIEKAMQTIAKKQDTKNTIFAPFENRSEQRERKKQTKVIFFSPSGKKFTTEYAHSAVKKYTDVILICGRYEGIDARVKQIFKAEEISIGDYVLTGGELPAMVMIDCMARQIPGVLGNFDSREESRDASPDVYTRPEVLEYKNAQGKIKKYKVPAVLLSGNPKLIQEWKEGKK